MPWEWIRRHVNDFFLFRKFLPTPGRHTYISIQTAKKAILLNWIIKEKNTNRIGSCDVVFRWCALLKYSVVSIPATVHVYFSQILQNFPLNWTVNCNTKNVVINWLSIVILLFQIRKWRTWMTCWATWSWIRTITRRLRLSFPR